jgi:hypothetical protein
MQNIFGQFRDGYQIYIDASRRYTNATLSGATKIGDLMIGSVQHVFHHQMQLAQALGTMNDQKSALKALQAAFVSKQPNEIMASQKEAIRIFAEAQNEILLSVQEYTQHLCAVSDTSRSNDSSDARMNDAFLDPLTSMTALWKSAFSEAMTLAQSTKEVIAAVKQESTDKKAADEGSAVQTQTSEKSAKLTSRS